MVLRNNTGENRTERSKLGSYDYYYDYCSDTQASATMTMCAHSLDVPEVEQTQCDDGQHQAEHRGVHHGHHGSRLAVEFRRVHSRCFQDFRVVRQFSRKRKNEINETENDRIRDERDDFRHTTIVDYHHDRIIQRGTKMYPYCDTASVSCELMKTMKFCFFFFLYEARGGYTTAIDIHILIKLYCV